MPGRSSSDAWPARAGGVRGPAWPRLLCCCLIGGLSSAWCPQARAEVVLSADIPPQPVDAALANFAHQTGLQLIYFSQLTRQRVSRGARAGLTAAAALVQLLDGTGLSSGFLNDHTVRIFDSAADAAPGPPTPPDTTLPRAASRERPGITTGSEVVVTRSREQDSADTVAGIQSIAASISVVGGERLSAQKLEQLSDYAAYLPGVNVVSYGAPGTSQILLRGISTFTDAATAAYYLDDTPMGASGPWATACCDVIDPMPYDLERLEVRRGPQGTRFGANSESGLIRFVLREPDVSRFEARVGADASTIHGAAKMGESLRAMVNVPLVADALALRVSAYDSYTPGYIDNAYNGASDVNVLRQSGERVTLLWRAAASLAVKVTAFWPRIRSASEADVSSTGVAAVPDTGDADIVKPTGFYGDLTDSHAFLQPFRKSIDYYAATVRWNPGSLEVLSATGWSRTQTYHIYDQTLGVGGQFPAWSGGSVAAGLAAFHKDVAVEKFTQELHIASSPSQRIEWLLGAFYNREYVTDQWALYAFDTGYQPIAAFAPAASATTVKDTFDDAALFGELTWRASERVDLTGGLRYARNEQQFTAIDYGVVDVPAYTAGRSAEGVTTGMIAASYRFTPDAMFYGRVASGSQPGSTNGVLPSVPPTFKPETVTNYELGVKSEFADRKALVNFTVFYIQWKDVQFGMCFDSGCGVGNGGTAVSRGLELTSAFAPLPGLNVGFSAAYTRSVLTTLAPGGQSFLTGFQLADVPKGSLSLSTDYDWAVTDLWHGHAGGVFRWVGQRWSETGVRSRSVGVPTMELPAYVVLDLNANIAKGPLTLRAFIRNFTDTRAKLQAIVLGDESSPATQMEQRILQPRTIGIGVDYAF